MSKTTATAIALAMAMGTATQADAQSWRTCRAPTEPYCVRGYYVGDFDSFACRFSVESYLNEVEEYQQCLSDKIEQSTEEANAVVDRFNCLASGNDWC